MRRTGQTRVIFVELTRLRPQSSIAAMSRPNRTLRVAVGTALFALGACQKDKAATETPEPEATEHSNLGPEGEPAPEHTNVGPETAPAPEPEGEPKPTVNPAPVTPKE
jgi:hypothetical protein